VSKSKTTKSISIPRVLLEPLRQLAEANKTSVSQAAARAIRALIAGEISLGQTHDPYQLGIETKRSRTIFTEADAIERIRQRDAERERQIANAKARAESEQADALVSRIVHASMPTGAKRVIAARSPASEPTFCAICTNDLGGSDRREPMGRDGAMVAVCTPCATEPPSSGRYSFSGESSRGMTDGNVWISGSSRRSALGSR
jgi:hypothetical protein